MLPYLDSGPSVCCNSLTLWNYNFFIVIARPQAKTISLIIWLDCFVIPFLSMTPVVTTIFLPFAFLLLPLHHCVMLPFSFWLKLFRRKSLRFLVVQANRIIRHLDPHSIARHNELQTPELPGHRFVIGPHSIRRRVLWAPFDYPQDLRQGLCQAPFDCAQGLQDFRKVF